MFGVGPHELLIVALLFLVVFGPGKAAGMARDFGRLVSGANRTVEEFKSEILSEEVEEARRTVETFRDGAATQASSESRNGDDEREELDL